MLRSRGKVTVTSAGTPVRLTTNESTPSARLGCHAFMVESLSTNTGKIFIGTSGMNKTTLAGVVAILAIPTSNILPVFTVGFSGAPNAFNLADYYVDADNSGEAVLVSTLEL